MLSTGLEHQTVRLNSHHFGTRLYNRNFQWLLEHDLDPALDEEKSELVSFFEIISENFIGRYGFSDYMLSRISERYPVAIHGASLSMGSNDDLDFDYISSLKEITCKINPPWVSDHICWTGIANKNTHDLIPIAYSEETLNNMKRKVHIVQDYLGRQLILENPSTYLDFENSYLSENGFINELCKETDCGIMLNISSLIKSSKNHGFDPVAYINNLPHNRIMQMNLAASGCGEEAVSSLTWELYQLAQSKVSDCPTVLAWESDVPDFPQIMDTLSQANKYLND
ncbi:MAG: DUF692 domain-containing protein [Marinobacterium sp.]|nr:DUF692 domain-containing protein [Marinobacterium sp.]